MKKITITKLLLLLLLSIIEINYSFAIHTNKPDKNKIELNIDDSLNAMIPIVGFDLSLSSIVEGNSGITNHTISVTMDTAPSSDADVDISSLENTATENIDYIAVSQTLTFPSAGIYPMTQQINISIIGDIDVELDENLFLTLEMAIGSELLADEGIDNHEVTITNDDSSTCSGAPTTWEFGFSGGQFTFSWSNGSPNQNTPAIINTVYSMNNVLLSTGDINACSLEVTVDGSLVISQGKYARIINDITNEGLITVRKEGSLVQESNLATITGSGIYNTQIGTTVLQDDTRFTYFSSPINVGTLAVFNVFADANWEYDSTTQQWSYLGDGSATSLMNIGQGYAVQGGAGSTETVVFSGVFNNGIVTQPLAFDVYNNVVTDYPDPAATDDDSNLVGNPYPSAISADDLISNNDISNVYIWTHQSDLAAIPTPEDTWAGDDYIDCVIGTCTDAPSGGPNGSHTGLIASGQGFFVTSTAATNLTFNNSMRRIVGNDQFRIQENFENDKIWLDMVSSIGFGKQIALTFTENGTSNFDVKYESKIYGNSYGLGFYSINDTNEFLTINDTGIFTETERTIPLGFYINSEAVEDLSIRINHYENLENVSIYLRDNVLNTLHDLKIAEYTFTNIEIGKFDERFEIILSRNPLSVGDDTIANDNLIVSNQNENTIQVKMIDGSTITNFKAYDVLGRLLIDDKTKSNDYTIKTSIKQGEILFIKAKLESGQVLSKKFIKL